LEQWRHTFESRGFILSRSKTEYLHCGFGGREEEDREVIIDRTVISKVEKFKYLGLTIQQKWDIDEDINHHIKVG